MSAEDRRELEPGRGRWERSQQSAHWREIGISAVAAAARYAAAPQPPLATPGSSVAPSETAEPKVVTLRDIEFFAA
ncbi:hypothetical protein [Ancylobacter defluvii]|uniref:Uncharacterized protein n=1 Tax=Ancylobacter defluvii TaxID=1282440 RepID=A0A9W6JX38_9HYPH|nr:hypothetical protein [Ancylobacter defluvii]MBS7589881.1 hypothetical protein [Ancylobacter defluvii]GLK83003.1 hypothetical protein GCM10017653_10720 [Ancylobacter defluvii]